LSAFGGVNYAFAGTFFATNRQGPLVAVPANPLLIDQNNAPFAANQTIIYYPLDYYAGPAQLFVRSNQTTTFVTMRALNGVGSYDIINDFNIASVVDFTATVTLPLAAWRIDVTNFTGAAALIHTVVTPSHSGAI
jgi:hypothetical protein